MERRNSLEDTPVERVDTGFRILDSILFAIVWGLVEALIAALVVFQLGYSLVTERVPSERVREFGNRLSAYAYQIFRYLTHNSGERPFPFSDLPASLEPTGWPIREKSPVEEIDSDYLGDPIEEA